MAKKVTGFLKLQAPAGAANLSPPIGWARPAASTSWNSASRLMPRPRSWRRARDPGGDHHHQDRSFTFEKTPPVSLFLKKAANRQAGAKAPGRDKAGEVTKAQVKEIAEQKMKDLNCDTIESAMRMIEGSARSMGLEVRE
jgi:large subunit ribosomal protein L11